MQQQTSHYSGTYELDVHDQARLTGSNDPGCFNVQPIYSALGSRGDGVDLTNALLLDILSFPLWQRQTLVLFVWWRMLAQARRHLNSVRFKI